MSAEETLCVCGHPLRAHEHHRSGTECVQCAPGACPRYRRWTWWRRLTRRG